MKPVYKRKLRKQIRKAFEKRCVELWNKVNSIGFILRYKRLKNEPRSETYFCLFQSGSIKILFGGTIEEMEKHIDRYYNLKVFL